MKIAFIGIGNVGFALADQLQQKGHEILVAHGETGSPSVQDALLRNPSFEVLPIQQALAIAEGAFLATPFAANATVLADLDFYGKWLVDCTNPVGPGTTHGLESRISGAEMVQQWAPSARVIKAFSIYGVENFRDPFYPGYPQRPAMLVAGDDREAKAAVQPLIADAGFEMKDTGPLSQALHLEHMTLLWVRMVRVNGHHPNFVWGYMER